MTGVCGTDRPPAKTLLLQWESYLLCEVVTAFYSDTQSGDLLVIQQVRGWAITQVDTPPGF